MNYLDVRPGSNVSLIEHEAQGRVTTLGTGDLTRMQLFQGGAGRAILTGARTVAAIATSDGIVSVPDKGLTYGASVASLAGDALFGASSTRGSGTLLVLATRTGRILTDQQGTPRVPATTALPAFRVSPAILNSTPAPTIERLQPRGDAAPATRPRSAKAQPTAAQTPVCAVPRLSPSLQVMQPSNAQVNWAAQMAEQGLLTGTQYTRPAGFDNLGLAAYAPNSDFPLIALDHPSSDSWNTVPRSVFEAVMAQESNWDQASWHAIPGVAGDPIIADYYGSAGTISTINYAKADCGYGISQVTTGMRSGDTIYSVHGQIKIAVDYQENIAAGLQILESTWNQLYSTSVGTP